MSRSLVSCRSLSNKFIAREIRSSQDLILISSKTHFLCYDAHIILRNIKFKKNTAHCFYYHFYLFETLFLSARYKL